jgi:tRNA (guanine-N7-)-methyltransferase
LVESEPRPGDLSPTSQSPLDWPAVFGNTRPVEIEVGFGKGLFLLTASEANPLTNYFGIEIVRKYVLFTANRLAKRNRTNVRLACADVRVFLHDRVSDASVQRVHVYFPDPWWKKRHHKRRVFTPEFADRCAHVLCPGGELLVATDVEDYAVMVRETVAGVALLRPLPPPSESDPRHDMDYLTNFERRFRKEGKSIHRLSYRREG